MTTLKQWQQTLKPKDELIFNASEFTHLNDEWVPFSIGMAVWYQNYRHPIETAQIGTHDKLCLCAINTHTDQRRRPTGINRNNIVRTLGHNGIVNHVISHEQYYKEMPQYKFVISPEGNGIDCHRHYEALMAGCIPIVEHNDKIKDKYKGCPILYTTDYSEITSEYLEGVYEHMLHTTYDFSRLFLSSHDTHTQSQIITNGNYWAERIHGSKWYI